MIRIKNLARESGAKGKQKCGKTSRTSERLAEQLLASESEQEGVVAANAHEFESIGEKQVVHGKLPGSIPAFRMNRLVVATHNSHKTGEIRQIVGSRFDEVVDLTAFPEISPAIEDGDTFEANARIKALHAGARLPGVVVLADDSGLEVDALGGAPGVFSARYAGEAATDAGNRAKLIRELGASTVRTARFRCVLALARDGEVLHVCDGKVEGRIVDSERGDGGFGYDPLFVPDGHEQSFAEMAPELKNRLSHRGRALQQLLVFLAEK